MQIKPIPHYLINKYNNCNHHENRPYIHINSGEIYLDNEWLNKQSHLFKENLIELLSLNSITILLEKPIDIVMSEYLTPIEWKIYHLYLGKFDYSKWYNNKLISNVSIVDLNFDVIKQVSINCCTNNKNFDDEIHKLDIEHSIIDNILKNHNLPVFVRLDQSSAKMDIELEPIYNAKQILYQITNSNELLRKIYRKNSQTHLIILPWKTINKANEFRIFIYNNKIVAISQQHLYDKYYYTNEQIKEIMNCILNNDFIKYLPYSEVVCDVFVDNNKCELIECNPYGSYSASGSGLFCWIKDSKLLMGLCDDVEFRFTI